MPGVDIRDCAQSLTTYPSKLPGIAQVIAQQHGVSASRRAVNGVVSAHHRLRVGFRDGGAEGRQVGVLRSCGEASTLNPWRSGSGPLCTA